MNLKSALLLACLMMISSAPAHAEFIDDVQEASASPALKRALADASNLVRAGEVERGNALILDVFPKEKRTLAQSFMLGNVLFKHGLEESYALHELVASKLPDEPYVQLEWGLQQHRAGRYAEAAAAYQVYLKANPNHATFWGLQAECLIRTGKTKDAANAWARSERATQGRLVDFERIVCEVNSHLTPDQDRETLRHRVEMGDVEAARKLVALDSRFESDWWNNECQPDYLKLDLELIQKQKWSDADSRKLAELLSAGESNLAAASEGEDVATILKKRGFFLDEQQTLPQDGMMLSRMLGVIKSKKLKSADESRELWGPRIAEQARKTKDAECYNAAANLYIGTETYAEIVRDAWKDVRDVRFATALLTQRAQESKLSLSDPELIDAAKTFPEDATIALILVQLTREAKQPLLPVLERAIKAEYSKFSLKVGLFPRPGATTLRAYFGLLKTELEKAANNEEDKK